MPLADAPIATLTICFSLASNASELGALDQAGRRVAEHPCAKPTITTKVEKNIHDELVTDRYISKRCPRAGSEIVRSSLSQYKLSIPLFASVTGPDSRVPSPFQIGARITSVKSRLGLPEVEKNDSITYLLPSETREERVSFLHDGTRVVGIQWSWYFD